MKLEIFPPGQAATIIIPKAILGCGCMARINRKVSSGNKTNWDNIPTKTNFGCRSMCLKSSTVMESATPNITTARAKFKTQSALLSKFI